MRFWVESLEIENFRNIKNAQTTFSPEINIISGENGQGKTNFLEALWLLSGGKSFRGAKDKDLVNIENEYARINSVINLGDHNKKVQILCANSQDKKGRYAKINGGQTVRATALAGQFYCVVFAPSHLSLVNGSPSLRRKLVDGALCQLYPGYIKNYKIFERYLAQKNSFLKNIKKYSSSEKQEMMSIYNNALCAYGYEIYLKRKEYISVLGEKAAEYYNQISGGKEKIEIIYQPFATTKEQMYNQLFNALEKDIKIGFSTCGVQREDIEIKINGVPAKDFASQGQQRSIVLALKLAESDIFSTVTSIQPVVLLDDVLSELDYSRQEYLLNHIKGKQVFITSCDEDRIKLAQSKKYYVKDGVISPCI